MSKCYLINIITTADNLITDSDWSYYNANCFTLKEKAIEFAKKIAERISEKIVERDEGNTFCHFRYSKRTPEKASSGSWEPEWDWTKADKIEIYTIDKLVEDEFDNGEELDTIIIIEEFNLVNAGEEVTLND